MALASMADDIEVEPETIRPRDRIRDYIWREMGDLDAWQILYLTDCKPMPPQMIENRKALLAIANLLEAIEARPAVIKLLSQPARSGAPSSGATRSSGRGR